jgi:CubicO group peptidase (beta-lactamase class C family)
MQLWEDGLIKLDQNINDFFPPGFQVINPKQPDAVITVRMLLNHTSSLVDDLDRLLSLCTEGDSQIQLDTLLINYFTPGGEYYDSANFSDSIPGEKYEYSNMGTCLLALIVENLT